MKTILVIFTLLIQSICYAQAFDKQFHYGSRSTQYGYPSVGKVKSVNDTLACIQFSGDMLEDNAYFACKYRFSADTLFMEEINHGYDINKAIEYSLGGGRHSGLDSVFLGYQPYYMSGGWPNYDSLLFEVEGIKYAHNNQCDTYCTSIPRPSQQHFEIKIWNGHDLLLIYQANLFSKQNVVRMTNEIYSSSCCSFWGETYKKLIAKIPDSLTIDGQLFNLAVELQSREFILTTTSSKK